MKFFLIQALLIASKATAFVQPSRSMFGVTALNSVADDKSSEAVKAALEASRTHGPTSKEARIAWETVEELNASDNSAAYTGGAIDDAEYDEKLAALSEILQDQKDQISTVKSLAEEIRSVKLTKPSSSPQVVSDDMVAALDEAKALTAEFGVQSNQAKLAWETVEDIASNDSSEAMKGSLEEECLVEVIEACEAIEELQRALFVEEKKAAEN